MCTARSLTISCHALRMPPCNHACPPYNHAHPPQPCMPPQPHPLATTHPPQPCIPPGNQAHPLATMHAPQQPYMPPQQPHMPPRNHAHPLATTHAPIPPATMHAPQQPCTPPCGQNHRHLWKYNLAPTSLRAVIMAMAWGPSTESKLRFLMVWPPFQRLNDWTIVQSCPWKSYLFSEGVFSIYQSWIRY